MLNRIENKVLDKMGAISEWSVMEHFTVGLDDATDILTNYFKSTKVIDGRVDLSMAKVESLYNVEKIQSLTVVGNQDLKDLGKLYECQTMYIHGVTSLTSLGRVRLVDILSIDNAPIKDLGDIRYLTSGTIKKANIENSGRLIRVSKDLSILKCKHFSKFGELVRVGGNLTLKDVPMSDLGSVTEIGKNLDIKHADIYDFGKLNTLGGFVVTYMSKMKLGDSGIEIIDLTALKDILGTFKLNYSGTNPEADMDIKYMKIPRMNKLTDFGLVAFDDEEDEPLPF